MNKGIMPLNIQFFAGATAIYTPEMIGIRQSIVDQMFLLNPYQIPMLTLLGFGQAVTNTTHEWFEDEMYKNESIATAIAADDATAIVVADLEPFRVDQVIKIGEELLLITAITVGTKTLTVVRGYAETTAAAVAVNDVVEAMFVEGVEGADARTARYKLRTPAKNYTQILDETILISGTAEAVSQYGIDNAYETEKQKKQMEMALQLEKAIINGIPMNNGMRRMMGGIRSFIKTNVADASGDPLTDLEVVNDLAQEIYTAGGFKTGGKYVIIVPAKQKRAISKLTDEKIIIQRADSVRGTVVDTIITDFGQFDIQLNDNLKSDELMLTDANRMSIKSLTGRDFFHTYMGKTGDSTKGQIVGEYTLEFVQEKAHGRIKNLG